MWLRSGFPCTWQFLRDWLFCHQPWVISTKISEFVHFNDNCMVSDSILWETFKSVFQGNIISFLWKRRSSMSRKQNYKHNNFDNLILGILSTPYKIVVFFFFLSSWTVHKNWKNLFKKTLKWCYYRNNADIENHRYAISSIQLFS